MVRILLLLYYIIINIIVYRQLNIDTDLFVSLSVYKNDNRAKNKKTPKKKVL